MGAIPTLVVGMRGGRCWGNMLAVSLRSLSKHGTHKTRFVGYTTVVGFSDGRSGVEDLDLRALFLCSILLDLTSSDFLPAR